MRPDSLNFLFSPLTSLNGVGENRAKQISKAIFGAHSNQQAKVVDLLFHLPTSIIDRRYRPKLNQLEEGKIATVAITVGEHRSSHNRRGPYRVHCYDETGDLTLVFFNVKGDYIARTLPAGETRIISGHVDNYDGQFQMVHPDHMVTEEELATMPLLEPVYRLTAGLSGKILGQTIRDAVSRLQSLPEWIEQDTLTKKGWADFKTALHQIHNPVTADILDGSSPARQRLAFDELLAMQITLILVRDRMRNLGGTKNSGDGSIRKTILDQLPFNLTGSQENALDEIYQDLDNEKRMIRLLQGDVGAGKTIVALLTMAVAAEAGKQAALMAPTDLLARQHFKTIEELAGSSGLNIAILTAREKAKERREVLDKLQNGEIDIVIGTHAIFQENVEFKDLSIIVIDEQHRFGVHQRLALSEKAKTEPDLLVLTATPIPRTLALAWFGDLDISQLKDKPAGRKPIDTRALSVERLPDIINRLHHVLSEGASVYWVCPLVEESEVLEAVSAETRFKVLEDNFPGKVALVHGRMKGTEKDEAMERFVSGNAQILVATTVIEVGVDVPNATIMVIEHAERFGLSQLHQLRGRVGRSDAQSSCLLLYKGPLGETAQARINTMRETNDGFKIAEMDLKLRGEGDILGARQSGLPSFKLAQLGVHEDLMQMARNQARAIIDNKSDLTGSKATALQTLLYLFERNDAIKLMESG